MKMTKQGITMRVPEAQVELFKAQGWKVIAATKPHKPSKKATAMAPPPIEDEFDQ